MYKKAIINSKSFNDIFELVKKLVEKETGMRRVGLTLLLQDMPGYVGAYHAIGSNYIVLNRRILNMVKSLAKNDEEYNSYLFVVIMHEYLHSLGLTDEIRVRRLTYKICDSIFGNEHITSKIATDPLSIYPEIRNLTGMGFGKEFHIIKDFDNSNMTYIG
ncbi:MAG: hypothetical protein QW416_07065 [Candidatus Nitrosocaldaceae archaeon]